MSIETMKLALEALESLQGGCTDSNDGTVEAITVWCPEVIDALRQAIEQAEKQEPYKGIAEHLNQATNGRIRIDHVTGDFGIGSIEQAQKQDHFPDATKMVTQKQEPVAFLTNRRQRLNVEFNATGLTLMPKSVDWKVPLYTSPPQRPVAEPHKPLTDEQITSVWETRPYFNDFARAIEAAHGITEEQK